jgi:hypothetical protein
MNFRIPEMQWQNLTLIDNALRVRMMGERNFDDCGRSQTIHLPLAWWKAEQFIELSKDKNPFNNPDKKHLDKITVVIHR